MKTRNPFQFKEFTIHQNNVTLPVTTDACLFGAFCEFNNPQNILDLGTGTGLLTLMLNQKYPQAKILGIEKHNDTAIQANMNVSMNEKNENITIQNDDMFTLQHTHQFDAIISNPPFFVNQLESSEDTKNQARHFQNYNFKDFFGLLERLLTNNGTAWILLPYSAKLELFDLLKDYKLSIQQIVNVSPTTLKKPHIIFIKLKKSIVITQTEISISIRNEKNQFTSETIQVLKPFYLDQAFNV